MTPTPRETAPPLAAPPLDALMRRALAGCAASYAAVLRWTAARAGAMAAGALPAEKIEPFVVAALTRVHRARGHYRPDDPLPLWAEAYIALELRLWRGRPTRH